MRSLLTTVNKRINTLLSQTELRGEPLTRSQAEQLAFQQLEAAFLSLSDQQEGRTAQANGHTES